MKIHIVRLVLLLSLTGCANSFVHNGFDDLFSATVTNETVASRSDSDLYNRINLLRFHLAQFHPDPVRDEELKIIRNDLVRRHPEWSDEIKKKVVSGHVMNGMTPSQVLATYGEPTLRSSSNDNVPSASWAYSKRVSNGTTHNAFTNTKTEYYKIYYYGSVVFTNGIVTHASYTR